MNASRPTVPILVAGLLSLLLLEPDFARPAEEKPKEGSDALHLISDLRLGRQLQAAADYAKDEDWKNAVRLLQELLDRDPDALARIAGRDGKPDRAMSVRAEAERLLAALPEAGREVYRRTHSPRAAELLEQARKNKAVEPLTQIVRRYLYTEAGPAALQELARRHYRAGRLHLAAGCYAKLVEHLGVARWTTDDLYRATVAFHHKNSPTYVDFTLKQLLARSRSNVVRLGSRNLTVAELRKEIERGAPANVALDWPVYGGNVARSAQGDGGPPSLSPIWRQSMFMGEEKENSAAGERLRQAEKWLREHQQPILPAFSPIVVTKIYKGNKTTFILYKNYWGIVARDLKTGEIAWESRSSWSLERMLDVRANARKQWAMNDWLDFYLGGRGKNPPAQHPQILFENSTVGTLSTDGRFVFAVVDFAVPPLADEILDGINNLAKNRYDWEIQDAIQHSHLQAFDLKAGGKLTWELGNSEAKEPLADCYFLGPPLPLGGLLYLLVEKEKELCLVCLDPDARGKLDSIQPLARVPHSLANDPLRRLQAVHLSYSDGILVCPTNAGIVLGVDVLSGSLTWAYPYADKDKPQPKKDMPAALQRSHWMTTAPIVAGGKVFFTPPDAPSIHCLNVGDGSMVWTKKKDKDALYLGGVCDGKVLIVGRKSVRALDATTGATLWTVATGLPSGQGIAAKGVYYLPLKETIHLREPEICAIDLQKGRIVAHLKSRTKETPGNLLFHEGNVISLSVREIAVYPEMKIKLSQMDELLGRNPNDPDGLTERAVLRLDKGDSPGAVEDLRNALKNNPGKDARNRARSLLFEALTARYQRDLSATDMRLKEYEVLCTVDSVGLNGDERKEAQAEQVRRRVRFFLLVARLRESQGRMTDALKAIIDLGDLGPSEEVITLPDDAAVKVRRDVWIRSLLTALLKRATPAQRKELEEELRRPGEKPPIEK
jgi:tetratricopeptide (TPR) repeat protein